MMTVRTGPLAPLFLSWNLRNIPSSVHGGPPAGFQIGGTALGEFPIDAWKPCLLEVPASAFKKDISGRSYHAFGIAMPENPWNRRRTVPLPLYEGSETLGAGQLRTVVRHWTALGIADDIPCLGVAIGASGHYCEDRQAQSVAVLLVWSDGSARIVRLDWAEGPLEDCVTPEWLVVKGDLTGLGQAIKEIGEVHRNLGWEAVRYCIHAFPACLGKQLLGVRDERCYKFWGRGWLHSDYAGMAGDLSRLLFGICELFSKDGGD